MYTFLSVKSKLCLLRLDLALLLLLQEPINTPRHALLQRPQRLVLEHLLRLGNIVVPRHGGKDGPLLGQRRLLLQHAHDNLGHDAQRNRPLARNGPHALGAGLVAGSTPHGARKVPKVHGRVVGDEEDLAVDALHVERAGARRRRGQQHPRRQKVGVRHVADIGKVENVGVVAQLELALAGAVGAQQAGERLHVALAKDAGGAERGGEEVGGLDAVGLDDEFFGGSLW